MKKFKPVLIYVVLLFITGAAYSQIPSANFAVVDPNAKRMEYTGFSTLIDRLGVDQISEILTLNLGGVPFTFAIHEQKREEIKTFKIATSGNINYTISSTSVHKDGRQHQAYGSGVVYLDKTKNYIMDVFVSPNDGSLYLGVKDIASSNNTAVIQPNGADNRIGGISPQNAPYFMRNGQKPVNLLLLNNVMKEKFYIYPDGVIQVYNIPNNTLRVCGQKAAPYHRSWNGRVWTWSFDRNIGNNMIETYTISTTGEVWAVAQDGTFRQFGYITYVDF